MEPYRIRLWWCMQITRLKLLRHLRVVLRTEIWGFGCIVKLAGTKKIIYLPDTDTFHVGIGLLEDPRLSGHDIYVQLNKLGTNPKYIHLSLLQAALLSNPVYRQIQSRVKIEHHSIAYFDCIITFKGGLPTLSNPISSKKKSEMVPFGPKHWSIYTRSFCLIPFRLTKNVKWSHSVQSIDQFTPGHFV